MSAKQVLSLASPFLKTNVTNLGIVSGNIVCARNAFSQFSAGIASLFGLEARTLTNLNNENREQAHNRMLREANLRGATHVLNVRYQVNSVMGGMAQETFVYGDAVKVE